MHNQSQTPQGAGMVLVTEFCEGGDLFAALTGPDKERFLFKARGKRIALQVLQALVHLHSRSVAHLVCCCVVVVG